MIAYTPGRNSQLPRAEHVTIRRVSSLTPRCEWCGKPRVDDAHREQCAEEAETMNRCAVTRGAKLRKGASNCYLKGEIHRPENTP